MKNLRAVFTTRRAGKTALAIIFAWLFGAVSAFAASTGWQDLGGGKVRLVASEDTASGIISGSVEVQLNKGWKTYWRSPGESGIPPHFDFSKSTGIKVGPIRYPAPYLLENEGVVISGYKHHVAFPFTAKHVGDANGVLSLNLLIGVCDTICIPARASLEIPLSAISESSPKDLQTTRMAVLQLPDVEPKNVKVLKNSIQEKQQRLVVEIALPGDLQDKKKVQLFTEDATGSFFDPVAAEALEPANNGKTTVATFKVPFEKSSDDLNLRESVLTFTIRAEDKAYELKHKPDGVL